MRRQEHDKPCHARPRHGPHDAAPHPNACRPPAYARPPKCDVLPARRLQQRPNAALKATDACSDAPNKGRTPNQWPGSRSPSTPWGCSHSRLHAKNEVTSGGVRASDQTYPHACCLHTEVQLCSGCTESASAQGARLQKRGTGGCTRRARHDTHLGRRVQWRTWLARRCGRLWSTPCSFSPLPTCGKAVGLVQWLPAAAGATGSGSRRRQRSGTGRRTWRGGEPRCRGCASLRMLRPPGARG